LGGRGSRLKVLSSGALIEKLVGSNNHSWDRRNDAEGKQRRKKGEGQTNSHQPQYVEGKGTLSKKRENKEFKVYYRIRNMGVLLAWAK